MPKCIYKDRFLKERNKLRNGISTGGFAGSFWHRISCDSCRCEMWMCGVMRNMFSCPFAAIDISVKLSTYQLLPVNSWMSIWSKDTIDSFLFFNFLGWMNGVIQFVWIKIFMWKSHLPKKIQKNSTDVALVDRFHSRMIIGNKQFWEGKRDFCWAKNKMIVVETIHARI